MKRAALVWSALGAFLLGYISGRYTAPDFSRGPDAARNQLPGSAKSPDAPTTPAFAADSPSRPLPASPAIATPVPPRDRLRELSKLKPSFRRTAEAVQWFGTLTATDIPAVLAAIRELPPGRGRQDYIGKLFEHWGGLDGPAALAAASDAPVRERWSAESEALDGWASVDPHAAWIAAQGVIADNSMGAFRVTGVMRALARVDLDFAIQQVHAATSSARTAFRDAVVEAAAEQGLWDGIMQRALKMESSEQREDWMNAIFSRWGSTDSEASLQAIRNLPDSGLADAAMKALISGWSEHDPKGAIEFALEHQDDHFLSEHLGAMLGQASPVLREAELLDLIETARAKGGYDAISSRLLAQLSFTRPSLALELAATVEDPRERIRLTDHSLTHWAHSDFDGVVAYFERMPTSPAKVDAFARLASPALEQSGGPTALARWLGGFSEDDRVLAATTLVEALQGLQHSSRPPLSPENAAVLEQAIYDTPGLPVDILDAARAALPRQAGR